MKDQPIDRSELYRLLGDYTNETIDAADTARLEQLLRGDATARRLFGDYMSLHAELSWRESGESELIRSARPAIRSHAVARGSSRVKSPVLGFLGNLAQQFGGATAGATFFQWSVLGLIGTGVATMLVMVVVLAMGGFDRGNRNNIGPRDVAQLPIQAPDPLASPSTLHPPPSTLNAPPKPPQCAARLTRVADVHWLDHDEAARPGTDLFQGYRVRLDSGLAEFYFEGGAIVVLHGPAQLQFLSRTSARLAYGSVSVTIEDPLSAGFELHTPGMKYTDLGTEFGVSVESNGKQEMHVFRGHVAAEFEPIASKSQISNLKSEIPNPSSTPTTGHQPPATLVLTAGQAVTVAAPGKPIEKIAAEKTKFIRNMSDWNRFPLFSTGVGLDRGAADPHWEITAISTDPNFKPRPAVVADPLKDYLHDDRDKAQWISDAKTPGDMPVKCRWTLRTHFDLTGFDPSTARIEGSIAVDNFLVEVRLNGKATSLPKRNGNLAWLIRHRLALKIEEGFVAGDNTMEFVIDNAGDPSKPNQSNPMAMCLDWKGTAKRTTAGASSR